MACRLKYVSEIRNRFPVPDATQEPSLILADSPFKPHGVSTSREQVKVTEDRCPSVFVIQELAHKDVY